MLAVKSNKYWLSYYLLLTAHSILCTHTVTRARNSNRTDGSAPRHGSLPGSIRNFLSPIGNPEQII